MAKLVKKLLKIILILAIVGMLFFGIFFALVYKGAFGRIHTEQDLRDFNNRTASLVLADDGRLLGKFFAEDRTNITFDQLPEHFVNALVATEDARYFEHQGVDSRSLLRVLFKTILLNKENSGGGSTLNQQLAKNMYGRENYGPLTMLVNKTKEAILANRLEKAYTKQEILALYANTVPFGENVFGVEAASRRFFNKSITKIRPEEAAVLVGMLKANTYYNPRLHPENALERRNVVLSQMEKYGYLTGRQKDSLAGLALTLDYANSESEGTANYFLVQIKKEATVVLNEINKREGTNYDLEKDGLIIHTTLDLDLQKQALKAFRSHLSVMQNKLDKQYRSGSSREALNALAAKQLENLEPGAKKDFRKNRELFSWNGFYHDSITAKDSIRRALTLLHAGLLALNPKTGAVKAWVGGIDFRTQPYDQILAQRQVASTFKPVLYATALENGIAPCSYLDNEPLILTDFDNWQPQNYDGSSGGKYSLAAALAKSMNIPTVNLYLQTPFEKLESMWKRLGFSQALENKPSTALGTASASIYELAMAYSTFANGGYHIEPTMIASIKTADGKILFKSNPSGPSESHRVVSHETTVLLTKILQKAIDEGTGTAMRNSFGITIPLAGKTGTSQDYADAWFAAYTPKIVIVTRVGASFPSIRFNSGSDGSGSRLALPIVGRTLKYLQKKYGKDFETLTENDSIAFDCDDFVADSDFTKFFESIFSSNRTTLEKAQKKAERKAKREQRRALRQKNRQ